MAMGSAWFVIMMKFYSTGGNSTSADSNGGDNTCSDSQGPKSTRYSTRTRTKHYSDRVGSRINSRNFTIIIQKQPWRRYFRIITANPDIHKQPSMEKISSDLHVKKMEDVSKLVIGC